VAQSGSALGWGPSGRRFESGRPDSPRRERTSWKGESALDTIYLLLGIIGFMALIAAFFFGGFVLLDFIWGRRGGDA
jgi:hypothetical protein